MPGRCTNEMFCSLAASGQIVRVPVDQRFVCPQCGRALVPPNAPFRSQLRRANSIGPLAIIMIILGFIAGMALGGAWVWPVPMVVVPVTVTPLRPPKPIINVPQLIAPPPATSVAPRPRRAEPE